MSGHRISGHRTRDYRVELPAFNGPLDLLLHLIERQQLDITAISLAQVAGQYLEQIERLKEDRLEELVDFLVIGARLVLIKSRALLPQPPAVPGAEEEEEDPAEALVRQLQIYRRFKQTAAWLAAREAAGLRSYLRVAPPPRLEPRLDLSGVTVAALQLALQSALARTVALEESVGIIRPRPVTIEEQTAQLRERVSSGRTFDFRDLLSGRPDTTEVSVTLLALLELVKRQEVTAYQAYLFGPIRISAASARPEAIEGEE
jgi:segregation and condensation protein A